MGTAGFRVQKGQEGKMGNVSKDEVKLRGHPGLWGGGFPALVVWDGMECHRNKGVRGWV